ncbi:N-methyl-L-tryptophan oxidase [Lentzea flaviverrucosa]|uniref:Sarcosine oxidase n=1 Tax=Lentzea flaviverrucosa TaxID=200379 RepID=A0A1H9WQY2_9PSEU|nr:N-methyl-L-tryptophan oxidase [Lentzea flaviverrucosa]RDI22973.1 sarcosine oxidase [Lentzea flaviverrucosa]SES35803.1 sarcosine oxidase [Lentzea flaviverrucosa]
MTYDVVVIGLGGMGSAAAYRLAQRGKRVLGLERFTPAHALGSSHGGSRITRQAYFEDPAYVPLLLRAHEMWDQVERDSGERIFHRVGGIIVGDPDSGAITGSRASVEQFGLTHELLDASRIRERFPALRPAPDEIGLYEPGAGFVVPETSVAAHLALARRAGADLRFEEPVTHWEPGRVTTTRGSYETGHVVLCPGPWAPDLLGDLQIPFEVERQVQFYFTPDEPLAGYPVYIWDRADGTGFYGFPEHDGAAKVAFHHGGEICTPETIDRTVHAREVEAIAAATRSPMPGLAGTFQRAATCMYTNTADRHFVIARHPEHDGVTVACGFSGHGFKFVPVVGEILADLAIDGATRHPITLFDPARLRGGA